MKIRSRSQVRQHNPGRPGPFWNPPINPDAARFRASECTTEAQERLRAALVVADRLGAGCLDVLEALFEPGERDEIWKAVHR